MNEDNLEASIDNTIDQTAEKGLDSEAGMEKAVDDVASSVLNIPQDELEPEPVKEPEPDLPVPKSWAKDKHEFWKGIPKEAKEYIGVREKQILDGIEQYKGDATYGKQMRDVITPYSALLQSQGVDGPKAVQYLLNAHYKLTNASPLEKQQYFSQLAKSYGIDLANLPTGDMQIDPHVKEVRERLQRIESNLTTREQAALTEARSRIAKDVESFAADPTHPYFDEVADDIVTMINAGAELKDAYEKAVWANPVTRAKEMARVQTENEAKLRDQSRTEATRARKASSPNVRGRDTNKAPTEPLGKMDDTLRETLRDIQSRTH